MRNQSQFRIWGAEIVGHCEGGSTISVISMISYHEQKWYYQSLSRGIFSQFGDPPLKTSGYSAKFTKDSKLVQFRVSKLHFSIGFSNDPPIT